MHEISERYERKVKGGKIIKAVWVQKLNPIHMQKFNQHPNGYYKVEHNKEGFVVAITQVSLSQDEIAKVPFQV